MIVGIHQPHYLPWLRYIDKIAHSDVFVLLDDTQFTKNGWQNRNKIKSTQGWMYLTVPVHSSLGMPINAVRIVRGDRWQGKHWAALVTNYSKAPFFPYYRDRFEDAYRQPWTTLADLNVHLLTLTLDALGITVPVVRSSQLGVVGTGTKRLAEICQQLGARTYLTGDFAAASHLEARVFQDHGIDVRLQDWSCPEYPQQHPQAGFIPDLSSVDLLFNAGPSANRLLGPARRDGAVPSLRA